MQERAVGFEMEFSVGSPIGEITKPFHEEFPSIALSDRGRLLLENGGQLYKDLGEMREYASPEFNPADSLYSFLAFESMSKATAQRVADEYRTDYNLSLSVADLVRVSGSTAGFHENYQQIDGERLGGSFAAIALMRYAWAGAASVRRCTDGLKGKAKLVPMQKIPAARPEGHKEEIKIKINTDDGQGRIELRHADYPMTYFNLQHRLAFTSAAMRLGSLSLNLNGVTPCHEYEYLLRLVSNDFSLDTKYLFMDSSKKTAIEHQQQLAELIMDNLYDDLPIYEREAVEAVAGLMQRMQDSPDSIHCESHYSVAKNGLLERELVLPDGRFDTTVDGHLKGLMFLGVTCSLGACGKLESVRGLDGSVEPSEERIVSAITEPPSLAAQKRVSYIKEALALDPNVRFNTDWFDIQGVSKNYDFDRRHLHKPQILF